MQFLSQTVFGMNPRCNIGGMFKKQEGLFFFMEPAPGPALGAPSKKTALRHKKFFMGLCSGLLAARNDEPPQPPKDQRPKTNPQRQKTKHQPTKDKKSNHHPAPAAKKESPPFHVGAHRPSPSPLPFGGGAGGGVDKHTRTMTLTLTPTEINTLLQSTANIIQLADQSTVIADAIQINSNSRKTLRQLIAKIHTQAAAQAHQSAIQQINTQ